MPAPPFLSLYLPFAAGYLLSYAYRNVNAVISPDLTREVGLSPSALGLLTSVYFITFGAMQIPAGMLLDRYGPRRVEPVLLVLAGLGALATAAASSETSLVLARAVVGMGVAICLMAPLKGIATWYPPERQASLAGWIMAAGATGALLATTPLELALRFVHWRVVFVVLAVATFIVAAWLWWRIPDVAPPSTATGFAAQWAGVRRVFASPRFWWLAPLGGFAMGSYMAIQGLWSVPWMMEVQGMDRADAARHLSAMGIVTFAGYIFLGSFAARLARRDIHARHLYGAGFTLHIGALAALVAGIPGSYLWWSLYGLGAAVNVLGFTVLNDGLPREIAGRANTALNLLIMGGSFVAQWGIGLAVDLARTRLALDVGASLRAAFVLVTLLEVATLAWFALGWRRHARGRMPLAAA